MLRSHSSIKRVEVLRGRRSNSRSYHYEGWTLHRVVSGESQDGVIAKFVCTQERQGTKKYCPYTLTILGDAEAITAKYVESGQHLDPCMPNAYNRLNFEQHVEWRASLENCIERGGFQLLYEEVKAELDLQDHDLPPLMELYKKICRKRSRGTSAGASPPTTDFFLPYKQPTKVEAEVLAKEAQERAAKTEQAITELIILKDRKALLVARLTNCRRQKAQIDQLVSLDLDATDNVITRRPDYEVIKDDGDIQVIKPIIPPDYLRTARPGREFPIPQMCYICNDGPSRALFLSCRKVSMCPSCAAKVQITFNRCTCCNSQGVRDENKRIRMQIVY